MRHSVLASLAALSHVPLVGIAQTGPVHIGVATQYVVLTGDRFEQLPNGPGLLAFAGYRFGAAVLRLGAGVSSHADDVLEVENPNWFAGSVTALSDGSTHWHRTRLAVFTEARYAPPTRSFTAPEFVGARVGWSRVGGLYPSDAWNVEATLGTTLPLGGWLRAEISAAGGIARFTTESYRLARWGNTFSVAIGLVATPRVR